MGNGTNPSGDDEAWIATLPVPCPADLNGDGVVNVLDLIQLVMSFGPCPGTPCVWDANGNGVVNQSDLHAVITHLGPCDDPQNCPWDVNGDGVLNWPDVQAVATHPSNVGLSELW